MGLVIFVFGSNLAGRHGRGAALTAKNHYKAQYGVGCGLTGFSYALPTRDENIRTLPLVDIKANVEEFINYAKDNPDMHFMVTKVGCGLAGYASHQIAPFFKDAPINCSFDQDWIKFLPGKKFFYRKD